MIGGQNRPSAATVRPYRTKLNRAAGWKRGFIDHNKSRSMFVRPCFVRTNFPPRDNKTTLTLEDQDLVLVKLNQGLVRLWKIYTFGPEEEETQK